MGSSKSLHVFLFVLLGILFCAYTVGMSRILVVPSEKYSTIQRAIYDADDGDVVLVNPGTYFESIDFLGKSITVTSHFWFERDEEYIRTTILRGQKSDQEFNKSIVSFVNGEDNQAILIGFTLSDGWGTLLNETNVLAGGAVLCLESTPTITNNLIQQNYLHHSIIAMGGGIYVKNNRINTQANRLIISNNTFRDNRTTSGRFNYGGAICIVGDGFVDIENNCFQRNGSMTGGAVAVISASPKFRNNIFRQNYANYGGALYLFKNYTPQVVTSTFDGAEPIDPLPEYVNRPEVAGSSKTTDDTDAGPLTITNCTFVQNSSISRAAALLSIRANPFILNSIFWANVSVKGTRVIEHQGNIFINYSDIQGGWYDIPNTYILDTDPVFENLNSCCLSEDSPCVDAGSPLILYNDPENPEKPGFAQIPAHGTLRNDMGAYGGPCACLWENPGIEVRKTLDYRMECLITPESIELNQNYPNPFNPSTTVSFFLEKESQVTLRVFNVLGEEVATILSDRVESGNHQITWNAGNLAGGVYLLRLETPQTVKTKKMILMK